MAACYPASTVLTARAGWTPPGPDSARSGSDQPAKARRLSLSDPIVARTAVGS